MNKLKSKVLSVLLSTAMFAAMVPSVWAATSTALMSGSILHDEVNGTVDSITDGTNTEAGTVIVTGTNDPTGYIGISLKALITNSILGADTSSSTFVAKRQIDGASETTMNAYKLTTHNAIDADKKWTKFGTSVEVANSAAVADGQLFYYPDNYDSNSIPASFITYVQTGKTYSYTFTGANSSEYTLKLDVRSASTPTTPLTGAVTKDTVNAFDDVYVSTINGNDIAIACDMALDYTIPKTGDTAALWTAIDTLNGNDDGPLQGTPATSRVLGYFVAVPSGTNSATLTYTRKDGTTASKEAYFTIDATNKKALMNSADLASNSITPIDIAVYFDAFTGSKGTSWTVGKGNNVSATIEFFSGTDKVTGSLGTQTIKFNPTYAAPPSIQDSAITYGLTIPDADRATWQNTISLDPGKELGIGEPSAAGYGFSVTKDATGKHKVSGIVGNGVMENKKESARAAFVQYVKVTGKEYGVDFDKVILYRDDIVTDTYEFTTPNTTWINVDGSDTYIKGGSYFGTKTGSQWAIDKPSFVQKVELYKTGTLVGTKSSTVDFTAASITKVGEVVADVPAITNGASAAIPSASNATDKVVANVPATEIPANTAATIRLPAIGVVTNIVVPVTALANADPSTPIILGVQTLSGDPIAKWVFTSTPDIAVDIMLESKAATGSVNLGDTVGDAASNNAKVIEFSHNGVLPAGTKVTLPITLPNGAVYLYMMDANGKPNVASKITGTVTSNAMTFELPHCSNWYATPTALSLRPGVTPPTNPDFGWGWIGWGGSSAVDNVSISFESNGGTPYNTLFVERGTSISSKLETPIKGGFVFGGWYTDSACTKMLSPDAKAHGNMTLYANWLSETAQAPTTPVAPAPVVPTVPTDVPQTGDSWFKNLFA